MIPIYENCRGYQPPSYARPTIAKLLSALPEQYRSGLQSVVLTNGAAIGGGKTMRLEGKKYQRKDSRGFYHRKHNGEQAWLEIVVDNVIGNMPRWAMRIPLVLVRDQQFAEVLFHEIGHHLEVTIGAPARTGEAAAEAWGIRLSSYYLHKRYWYLLPAIDVALALLKRLGPKLESSGKRG